MSYSVSNKPVGNIKDLGCTQLKTKQQSKTSKQTKLTHTTLFDPMDCSLPGSTVHGDSPSKNTGVGCHALLQGIFLTQRSNSGLPHCRQILYHLSHQESSKLTILQQKASFSFLVVVVEINYTSTKKIKLK